MNAWDYLASLRHRWKLIALILLATLAAVALWSITSPRRYEASATLLIGGYDPAAAEKADGDRDEQAVIGTQADVIRSDLVARQVVAALDLTKEPGAAEAWRAATGGQGTMQGWLARRLSSGIVVSPTKNTNVVRVTYASSDPDKAARVANGFADAFVKTQLMLRVQPARVYTNWYRERTMDVRRQLADAQAALTRYQRANALIGNDRTDVEMNRLADLSAQLVAAEAASAEAGARAGSSASQSTEVQSSALVQNLRASIATATAKLEQLGTLYGSRHPDVMATRAELATLQGQLAQAIGSGTRSVQVASTAARGREGELRQRMAQQRARILALAGHQDQLAILQRDVDTARAQYDSVTQRLSAMRMQSALPQANASILDRASPSYMPVSPNVPMRFLLGGALGLALGITLALFLEWRRPRFRTDFGLEQLTGVPVMASLERWPLKQRRLEHQG